MYLTEYQLATDEKVFQGALAAIVTPYYDTITMGGTSGRVLRFYTGLQYLNESEEVLDQIKLGIYIKPAMLNDPKTRCWSYFVKSSTGLSEYFKPAFSLWSESYQVTGKALLHGAPANSNGGISVYCPYLGISTITASDGSFTLANSTAGQLKFPPGLYGFVFKKAKYLTQVRFFEVKSGQIVIPDVTLPCGDLNEDGVVDSDDLTIFQAAYGSVPGNPNWNPDCDFDKNNSVGAADLVLFNQDYTKESDATPDDEKLRGRLEVRLELDTWNSVQGKWVVKCYVNDVYVTSVYIQGVSDNKNNYRGICGVRAETEVADPVPFGPASIINLAVKDEGLNYNIKDPTLIREMDYQTEGGFTQGNEFANIAPYGQGNILQVVND